MARILHRLPLSGRSCVSARGGRALPGLLALLLVAAAPAPGRAWETEDGRVALHGYTELQLRALSADYTTNNWYMSQWANLLDLELELNLLQDGWGPFDSITGFARVEVRFECAFSGCGIMQTYHYFGDRADRAPADNWRDARTTGFVGNQPNAMLRERVQGDPGLLTITSSPLIRPLLDLGAQNLAPTLAPVADDLFNFKGVDGTREHDVASQLGPWSTKSHIEPLGALRTVHDPTAGLPFRPAIPDAEGGHRLAQGLYIPSYPLTQHFDKFDSFDQNFSQGALQWNHGGGQDEHELKEAYLDIEMFDSRLWLRLGKQNIVWGKTELFRTTDQFNPQDIGLSSLPSLEESRLALWSARAIYSLYDVGPLEDVRLEVAVNLDDFEPTDLGRCGEPYTVWLVCSKSLGLWAHGVTGLGLAGEERPPNPWKDASGLEVGGRVEWRWDRFSFAVTDFWGYSDSPAIRAINFYERKVDPRTGKPLDVLGRPMTEKNALQFDAGNRQLFDLVCSATVGVAATLLPQLGDSCVLDVLNNKQMLGLVPAGLPIPDPSPAQALGSVLSGRNSPLIPGVNPGNVVLNTLLTGEINLMPAQLLVVPLNADVNDGPPSGFLGAGLGGVLTDQQEALLGCGPFYHTDCDEDGIDLYNTEASVLLQSFPFLEPRPPVGTRFADGKLFILPGARGPGDKGYDPGVDGTPPPGFKNEMAALSQNFVSLLTALGVTSGTDPDCTVQTPATCEIVGAVLAITGTQRPEIRAGGNGEFGRRDFLWASGGEAVVRYPKRNVLGFSADFAEDLSKTNWSFEFTWIGNDTFGSAETKTLLQKGDNLNLTISVDRPTFVNFLNANRTIFFNAQLFLNYLPDYGHSYTIDGPWSALFTIAAFTGYYQDRLLPSLAWVHDIRSSSGGVLPSVTYRYSENFSVTFGLAWFYGSPENADVPLYQLALANNGGDFRSKSRYSGLAAIAERDEVYLRLRYTF